MVERAQIKHMQNLGASLVREYLFRMGLKCTLKSMDSELPRSSESFNNRILLARELKIEHLLHEYKQINCPVKSVLEMLLCIFLKTRESIKTITPDTRTEENIARCSFKRWSNICQSVRQSNVSIRKSQMINADRLMWFYRRLSDRGVKIDFQTLVHIYCDCFGEKRACNLKKPTNNGTNFISTKLKGRVKNGDRDENGEYKDPRDEYDETLQETLEYNRMHPKKYPPISSKNALKEKENILLESIKAFRGHTLYDNKTRLGPDKLNTFQNLKRSRSTSAMEQATLLPTSASQSVLSEPCCDTTTGTSLLVKSKSISLPQSDSEEIPEPDRSETTLGNKEDTSTGTQHVEKECSDNLLERIEIEQTCDIVCNVEVPDVVQPSDRLEVTDGSVNEVTPTPTNLKVETRADHSSTNFKPSVISNKTKPDSKTCSSQDKQRILESLAQKTTEKDDPLEGCDEDENEVEIQFVPLKLSSAVALKKLILGSAIRSFNQQWMGQSFIFSSNPRLRYGFVQNKGGACGVLASIQGFLLKALLFHPSTATSQVDPLRPTRQEVRKALIKAITEVLWRAGGCRQAALVRSNQEYHLEECLVYRPDGLTEFLLWRRFFREQDLQDAVEKNLDEFISPLGKGCLRLIVSTILSCGIQSVLADMDDESSPLVGPSGTCSLELVNLLLTGRAVSNVFDNDLQLDSCLLRGISKRSEIGFLSIFEHFNSCQVGSNLKTPRFPIWLVNSDNHFSVVFSPCKQLVSDWRAERQFHLFHYDGLASQAEETVLNIDTTGFSAGDNVKRENVPPLELCIKTKWNDAVVHWNTKPL